MAKWMDMFVEEFKAEEGRELTKKELIAATPLLLNIDHNPKKKGSMSYDRFQGYFKDGVETIGDAFAAGLRQDDIRHDSAHGFILLGDAVAEFEASKPVEMTAGDLGIEG